MTDLPLNNADKKKSGFWDFAYFVMMRAIWHYIPGYRRQYITGLIMIACAAITWLAGPYLMGQLFNTIQDGLKNPDHLHKALWIVLMYFALQPLSWVFHGPGRIIEKQAGFIARQNFVQNMYAKLQDIPYAWHQNFHSGQLFDRIRKAESAIETVAGNQFRYIYLVVNFLGPAIALTFFFPWFGVTCLVFSTIAMFIINRFDRKLVPLFIISNKLSHDFAGIFSDYVANIRTIITLRLGRPTQKELLHRYQLKQEPNWKEYRVNEGKWATIEISSEMMTSILVAVAMISIYMGADFKVGSLVMLIQYLERYTNVFWNMGNLYQEIVKSATDYRSTLIIEEAYKDYQKDDQLKDTQINWQTIGFKDLSFAYQDTQHRSRAIDNVSFDIRTGEKIALVGHSGSGKSTLMTLLRGLYKFDKGNILMDGVSLSPSVLGQLTTLIPQDPEIFENTIRYNITFGVEHSDEEIMQACAIAGFDSVLEQLPQGLESDIREKGVNLSGGQKQRLALARGVFAIQQSSLILLDEPTSSVDTITEIQIFDRLFKEFADKAVIASVHRLHLLPRFDRVIMMESGKLIEEGSFDQLLQQNGALAQIWAEYQAEQVV